MRRSPLKYRNTNLSIAAQSVAAHKCSLILYNIINSNLEEVYVKFYDTTFATAGTTAPVFTIKVEGSGTVTNTPTQAGIFNFETAMWVSASTDLTDNGTTAPSSGILIELTYDN